MTDKRLAEISESACIRHAVLTQVPSKFDPRVKECNDEIGELIDHCLSQRFRANNFQARLASAESRIAEVEAENLTLREELKLIRLHDGPMKNLEALEAENRELRKDKARLGFSVSYSPVSKLSVEMLERSVESIGNQQDAINRFAYYIANCTPLEGMKAEIQVFAPNEDQPANG